MAAHGIGANQRERLERAADLLEKVDLDPMMLSRFPHEFSGGQRQRIGIARALALEPKFIVCDEVTSALDVSVQARILRLLDELKQELDLTYLFITHNIDVVRYFADDIAVMYQGTVVEHGLAKEVCDNPRHPYTRALLSAVPRPDPARREERERIVLSGDVPSPSEPPAGCHFHPRCPHPLKDERCAGVSPVTEGSPGGYLVACHHAKS